MSLLNFCRYGYVQDGASSNVNVSNLLYCFVSPFLGEMLGLRKKSFFMNEMKLILTLWCVNNLRHKQLCECRSSIIGKNKKKKFRNIILFRMLKVSDWIKLFSLFMTTRITAQEAVNYLQLRLDSWLIALYFFHVILRRYLRSIIYSCTFNNHQTYCIGLHQIGQLLLI